MKNPIKIFNLILEKYNYTDLKLIIGKVTKKSSYYITTNQEIVVFYYSETDYINSNHNFKSKKTIHHIVLHSPTIETPELYNKQIYVNKNNILYHIYLDDLIDDTFIDELFTIVKIKDNGNILIEPNCILTIILWLLYQDLSYHNNNISSTLYNSLLKNIKPNSYKKFIKKSVSFLYKNFQ